MVILERMGNINLDNSLSILIEQIITDTTDLLNTYGGFDN